MVFIIWLINYFNLFIKKVTYAERLSFIKLKLFAFICWKAKTNRKGRNKTDEYKGCPISVYKCKKFCF